jgi:molybdopterin-guanine dinucleotide biosynthesis protein A
MANRIITASPCSSIDVAILAGGQSKRLGFEKTMLPFGESTLLETVVEEIRNKIAPCTEIMIIKRPEVKIPEIKDKGVKFVNDALEKDGALIGILTALLYSKTDYCFIFACDMPFLNGSLISKMLNINRKRKRNYDALVPYSRRGIEPLHAIYSRRCLKKAYECINNNDLSVNSLLKQVKTEYIKADLYCNPDIAFMNINTIEDYELALYSNLYSNRRATNLCHLQELLAH